MAYVTKNKGICFDLVKPGSIVQLNVVANFRLFDVTNNIRVTYKAVRDREIHHVPVQYKEICTDILNIEGIDKITFSENEMHIWKFPSCSWDDILPTLERLFEKHFPDIELIRGETFTQD